MSKKLILCYGTLKSGHHNNTYLKNSKLLGTFVTEPKFTMISLGGFPAVVERGNTPITGEVYEVSEQDLPGVYALEGYKGQRDNPENWYNTAEIITDYGVAEMFTMNQLQIESPFGKEHNKKIIENGIW